MNFLKEYWYLFLLLFVIGGIYFRYDPNYCYVESKKYTLNDFKGSLTNRDITTHLASYFGLKEIKLGVYDTKKLEGQIEIFYNKYPNLKTAGIRQESEPEFYAYEAFEYFFSPKDINGINDYKKKGGWGNRPMKKIIGYQYIQFYGPCGNMSFGDSNEIYEGDEIDLRDNPYRKNENK